MNISEDQTQYSCYLQQKKTKYLYVKKYIPRNLT